MKTDLPSLFVIGNPRSGTTLLRLMLASHSRLVIPPECSFITWLHGKYGDWSLADTLERARRDEFLHDLAGCRKFETWGLDRALLETALTDEAPATYAELCATIYLAYARSLRKDVALWGDKNNHHVHHLEQLNRLYPATRFLHIVRDGRDVACSYREAMGLVSDSPYAPRLATDLAAIAEEWSTNVMKVREFTAGVAPERSMTIRYEDLVAAPEQLASRLCSWLGLEYEPAMLDFHARNAADRMEPLATMDWKMRTVEPISDRTVGRYRELLDAQEIRDFHERAGRALRAFGYEQ